MTRQLAKFALYTLGVIVLADMQRHFRRRHDRATHREALMTWEDEGGALPAGPATTLHADRL